MPADDTNVFHSHRNMKALFKIFKSKLKLVNEWFLANKLLLNAKRECVIQSHCRCQP